MRSIREVLGDAAELVEVEYVDWNDDVAFYYVWWRDPRVEEEEE